MTFESLFEDFMNDTVTWEPLVSTTGGGSGSYGAARSWKCRIEQETRLVRDKDGREVASNTRLYLRPRPEDGSSVVPTANDRFTLPAGYSPQAPPVISVGRLNDEEGIHSWVINL